MWLAALLAMMGDAAEEDARQAALREVARRLEFAGRPGPRPPRALPLGLQFLLALETLAAQLKAHPHDVGTRNFVQDEFSKLISIREMLDVVQLPSGDFGFYIYQWFGPDIREVVKNGRGGTASSLWMTSTDYEFWMIRAPSVREARRHDPTAWQRTESDELFALFLSHRRNNANASYIADGALTYVAPDTMTSLRDWNAQTHPDLSGMTFLQAVDHAEAWHRALRLRQTGGLGYGSPLPDALVVLRWPSGVTWQRLLTKKQFMHESLSMGHCIGGPGETPDGDSSYWRLTRDDTGATWSLRSPTGIPAATVQGVGRIALKRPKVIIEQIQGPDNDEVSTFDDTDNVPDHGDAVPFLLDALYRMGILDNVWYNDPGPFGSTRLQADERLNLEDNPDPEGEEMWPVSEPDPRRKIGVPAWFPDLDAATRAQALRWMEKVVAAGLEELGSDPDEPWVRLCLAPRSAVFEALGLGK